MLCSLIKKWELYVLLLICACSCSNPTGSDRTQDKPSIVAQSKSYSVVSPGDSLALFVSATGASPLYYYWIKNNKDTVGTDDTLLLCNVQKPDSNAVYRCYVYNRYGSVLSAACTVSVGISWDTSFSIAGVPFPNSNVFSIACTGWGNNWRMQQFLNKCKTRTAVTVGFIGGSITAGASATDNSQRFSSLLCSYIKKSFVNLGSVNEINAGIGATGSRFGCSRLADDLLKSNPDIIVVEYAVNDYGAGDSTYIRSCMEGLVRQCLSYKIDVPVLMLFMSKGNGENVQALQSDVGQYYKIPMISFRDAIKYLMPASEWETYPNTYFENDPHPNNNGHKLAAYLLFSYLKQVSNDSIRDPEYSIPSYKYSDVYQYAGIIRSSSLPALFTYADSGWQMSYNADGWLSLSSSAKASYTFTTCSNDITLAINLRATDTSSIRVIVDNGALDTVINNYYPFSFTGLTRLYTTSLTATHTVRIEKMSDKNFKIDYILYAKEP